MQLNGRPLFDNPRDVALFAPRDEATRLEANCRDGVNTLVLGERGAGKTSLLRYVLFSLRESNFPAVGVDAASADSALGIVRLVAAELGRRSNFAQQFTQPFDPHGLAGLGEVGELIDALRGLRPSQEEGPRTGILLDSPPGADAVHTLFGRLRDELWQLPFTWVVSAPVELRGSLLTPPADAFFEDVIELEPLTPQQQAELISRRLEPRETTPWRLSKEGEGNPRRLLEAVRESIRTGEPPESRMRALAQRQKDVNTLGRAAAMLYAELENSGSASASDDALLARLGWSRQRAAQVFAELERVGVVRAEMRPGPSGRPRKVFAISPVES